jgi:Spy/CpxP family protein refolding chaperone
MTKPWQIWLVLIAIFGTGTAGGWLVARHAARRSARHLLPPEGWAARQFERVAEEVQLTPEQKERIKPIVAANIDEMLKLRRQALDIVDRMEKQIAAELTPEQRAKYEQILQERRAARRQAQDMRNARHRADDAPPAGPPPPPPPPEKSTGT